MRFLLTCSPFITVTKTMLTPSTAILVHCLFEATTILCISCDAYSSAHESLWLMLLALPCMKPRDWFWQGQQCCLLAIKRINAGFHKLSKKAFELFVKHLMESWYQLHIYIWLKILYLACDSESHACSLNFFSVTIYSA